MRYRYGAEGWTCNFTRSLCIWICNYIAHCYCEGGYIAFDKEAVGGFLISTGLLSRNGKGTDVDGSILFHYIGNVDAIVQKWQCGWMA
ncbi:uncharacterized protein LOC131229610 isoform X3 [Magnolia sinica]|uniref:uncharacterized protein LOC131229610 isoform X3 n=1 Tax=Magnolia sinica TaxID=86752 RepID=UPI0026595755|nr:uncharacterized protein LOC131229610 isoform X3 [Magnolia sinica]